MDKIYFLKATSETQECDMVFFELDDEEEEGISIRLIKYFDSDDLSVPWMHGSTKREVFSHKDNWILSFSAQELLVFIQRMLTYLSQGTGLDHIKVSMYCRKRLHTDPELIRIRMETLLLLEASKIC